MQGTRLRRTETRSQEGCQEFRERSGCVESLSTVNGPFESQQDCSRVSLSLKQVFFSRIVVSWWSEPPRKTIFATKCLRMALSCATVVPHFIRCHVTLLQALHHNFCNCRERKWNRPFTRPIFLCGKKWSGNKTTVYVCVSVCVHTWCACMCVPLCVCVCVCCCACVQCCYPSWFSRSSKENKVLGK